MALKKKKKTTLAVYVCTFAGRVKQRGLERDDLHVVQVFLDGHLNRKASVWVHIGKGQQICGSHKEVSMERVDGQTCRETERDKINQTGPNYNTTPTKMYLPGDIMFSSK